MGSTIKKCELCKSPAIKSERYCRAHRLVMLTKMVESGYLRDDHGERYVDVDGYLADRDEDDE